MLMKGSRRRKNFVEVGIAVIDVEWLLEETIRVSVGTKAELVELRSYS